MKKQRKIRKQNIIQLLLSLVAILLLNIISHFLFTRFDLTTEKRYTLSKETKSYIKKIDDFVYFKVYLDGDFPAGFKRLRSETKEMLDEFRAYNQNIQYKFIDPTEGADKGQIKNLQTQLVQKGLQPFYIKQKTKDGASQQIIFPGALVSYRDKEIPMQLLMNQRLGSSSESVLNYSIQNLEYNIVNTLRKLVVAVKPRIGILEGHGELSNERLNDIIVSLRDYYDVDRVAVDGRINSLFSRVASSKSQLVNKYSVLIIAKPDSAFEEKDKYFIDQHIMHGGKVLWLIDPVYATMDSLKKAPGTTIGFPLDLNLNDMLFKYGVRINSNLLLDMSSLPIPLVTGQTGGKPQMELVPWFYFPLIFPKSEHPIVKNLNGIVTEFCSTMDTVGGKGIKKTVLLYSSNQSRTLNAPTRISIDIMYQRVDERLYHESSLPVAVLLEGEFGSVYNGRLPMAIASDKESFDFRDKSPSNKMIVISDGDVIKNQLDNTGNSLPLGYDKYTAQTYGNKDFIMNCIDYLTDDSGIFQVRSREIQVRLLDKSYVDHNKLKIQLINILGSLSVVLLLALILLVLRRFKYSTSNNK